MIHNRQIRFTRHPNILRVQLSIYHKLEEEDFYSKSSPPRSNPVRADMKQSYNLILDLT